jgi:TetR/AcrR family transcriptional regulator, transcriptional repressor for nem operon
MERIRLNYDGDSPALFLSKTGPVQLIEDRDVESQSGKNSRDTILDAATKMAQAHGYGGLNLRALAESVGIKAASLYHHFPSKADLAAAVGRRYWEDAATVLETLTAKTADPIDRLRKYPGTFRKSLENDNRICFCSFMTAEYDDLPEVVKKEVESFNETNVAWLAKTLVEAGVVGSKDAKKRAHAIFAAVAGAQLMARGRSDIKLYDMLIKNYQAAGLLPA